MTETRQNGKIGWRLIPCNAGNLVSLLVADGYRERDDGRILDHRGKVVRMNRGDRIEPIWPK